ncbi:hypothetical protein K504DRAFT_434660 [Pleomassaria siparia CBS 279.74]|uniref:Uncharacterized protein n=1 Tax=Pleomassaria siparia CBS 279.74 TaxID=1314801 RepID=A0A6G1K6B1_9PLEO|nr:hypothetical protein K504DRAFT_434660 [Pleomassaria siparia CBS 279.74]
MPLRRRITSSDASGVKVEAKKGKRQRILDFFRKQRQKDNKDKDTVVPIPIPVAKNAPPKPPRDSKIAPLSQPAKSSSSVEIVKPEAEQPAEQTPQRSPTLEPKEKVHEVEEKDKPTKVEALAEEHVHAFFSGAPHFSVHRANNRETPRATFPWDEELTVKDVSDSAHLAHPAFSAATLHRHLPTLRQSADSSKISQGYDIGVVEVPSMLGAQGIEPGTIGFAHFLELPKSDNLITDLQQSQSANGALEALRNKEQMQSNPERLGIRQFDMKMIYDRLNELGDLFEAFHDSPERMTILNNQTSGDLYTNLFGKFLSPPKYDDTADDPLGMKVQIDTLLKVLRLKGVWYDFSLVEWRIRLGQILWSDGESLPEHEPDRLWEEREILLLQIVLSCELLLRLDAVSSLDPDYMKGKMHVTPEDYKGFLNLKTRKTDWDMVLARRFLENILVTKDNHTDPSTQLPGPRGILGLSLLSRSDPQDSQQPPQMDVVLLPRHQARQLSGLLHFAETIRWPGMDDIVKELARKLGVPDSTREPEQPAPSYGNVLGPSSPSISVYGTPLATPRSTATVRDSYFGHMSKPDLSRNNSRSLTIPLSTTLLAHVGDSVAYTQNVGGWLSRSYLTGLVLPGEGISHFLMSTLLENDKLAIAALGDSADLYGGFVYAGRSWWSKSSIIGRVLACLDGNVECMGWICVSKPPQSVPNGWYALTGKQLRPDLPHRIEADEDLVAQDSALIPGSSDEGVNPEHLSLPLDSITPPIPSLGHTGWSLIPIDSELSENEGLSGSPSESDATHLASVTFSYFARGTTHTLTLTHDVQFVSSFPCTPPAASSVLNVPQILSPALPSVLSRSSSKRSLHSTLRLSRAITRSRRNSHGFEPLFSHPPDSPGIAPTPVYTSRTDPETGDSTANSKPSPMMAHPLHTSYKYKVVPVTEVIDPTFIVPFSIREDVDALSMSSNPTEDKNGDGKLVLVLDARSSKELELLARAWCAEKGLHAIIGRVGRSCLACCIRQARGLGMRIVVRV